MRIHKCVHTCTYTSSRMLRAAAACIVISLDAASVKSTCCARQWRARARIAGRGSSVAVVSAMVTRKSPRDAKRTERVWVSGRESAGVGERE